MFDIRGEDIARLGDADLRTLVARLAIAELASKGSAVSAVTAGGNQDAPDGGLDVRVELNEPMAAPDFVLRSHCGFQVKRPDMPPAKIAEEMRPQGRLRPVIGALADVGGAYIIVSAQGSVADAPLAHRRAAMREALEGHPNSAALAIEFYDRDRLAVWVNQYPGVAAWVRRRIGGDTFGWGPVGQWADTGVAADGGYLSNDAMALIDERTANGGRMPVLLGLEAIRASLSRPAQSVRLIGLSGLGKTRLVQALFEHGVGDVALDPALSVYTDYADDVRPSAREMARRLVDGGRRAILVVDNCNPATHTELAATCSAKGSQVSLLTVEYDVRDDEPEQTEVFRLVSGSAQLVEQWLERDFDHISQVDRRRIAEFSDGNFRVARALADTLQRGETLGQLRSRDLFERIFSQRNAPDGRLLVHAESLSLLYSFEGDATEPGSELDRIARLAGCTAQDLFASVVEMRRRGVVQARGRWRAVLPHAIANPLAVSALERLPADTLDAFSRDLPDRMLKSLTRRVGYLHDSAEAAALVARWLAPEGRLARLAVVPDFAIVQNLAPVDPDAILRKIEETIAGEDGPTVLAPDYPGRHAWIALLRSLSYEPALFDRAASALLRFVFAEPVGQNHNAAGPAFAELFHLYLSGTQAPPAQRLAYARSLLASDDAASRRAGRLALDALLKVSHFTSSHAFDFGARPRDFGWQPRLNSEVWDWYRQGIQLALDFDDEDVRAILAGDLRDLWMVGACHDLLDEASTRIAAEGGWIDGWIGFRGALRFDGPGMSEAERAHLQAIIARLEPAGHIDRARAFILSHRGGIMDVADGIDDDPVAALDSAAAEAVRIGTIFAADRENLRVLLPEILAVQYAPRASEFGRGLAQAADSLADIWEDIRAAYGGADPAARDATVLGGFLNGAQAVNPGFVSDVLERALGDADLGPMLPYLQSRSTVDADGIARLIRVVAAGVAPPAAFRHLATGIVRDMPYGPFADLLRALAAVEGGVGVALDILHMRFYVSRTEGPPIPADLVSLGRDLLVRCDFADMHLMRDLGLAAVIRTSLAGGDGAPAAARVCASLRATMDEIRLSAGDVNDVLKALFQTQPDIALDTFILADRPRASRRIFDFGFMRGSPVEHVEAVTLQAWADRDPETRYPLLGQSISLFTCQQHEETNEISQLFLALLAHAPDKAAFLGEVYLRLHPQSWTGSLAGILERRRTALEALTEYPDVVAWYDRSRGEIERWINENRRRESQDEETFE